IGLLSGPRARRAGFWSESQATRERDEPAGRRARLLCRIESLFALGGQELIHFRATDRAGPFGHPAAFFVHLDTRILHGPLGLALHAIGFVLIGHKKHLSSCDRWIVGRSFAEVELNESAPRGNPHRPRPAPCR